MTSSRRSRPSKQTSTAAFDIVARCGAEAPADLNGTRLERGDWRRQGPLRSTANVMRPVRQGRA